MAVTISASDVKELRERSGAGMMECKKALEENGGDMAKAMSWLREKGIAAAGKKASREAKEGLVGVKLEGRRAALVEVACETDFVAKTDDFKNLVAGLAEAAFKTASLSVDPAQAAQSLLTQPSPRLAGKSLDEEIKAVIGKLGENMFLARAAVLEAPASGGLGTYVHGGKLATVVALSCGKAETASKPEFEELARDLAMQAAGANPPAVAVSRDRLPADFIAKEKEIALAQARATGKPEAILPKIAEGKVNKVLQEVSLLDQAFIKEPDKTVAGRVAEASKALGDTLKVENFVRLKVGEKG
jgi:elongation factor Ts